jgi:hypothetical protein
MKKAIFQSVSDTLKQLHHGGGKKNVHFGREHKI